MVWDVEYTDEFEQWWHSFHTTVAGFLSFPAFLAARKTMPISPKCLSYPAVWRMVRGTRSRQIIEEWIETAMLGRPIPRPKGRLAYA